MDTLKNSVPVLFVLIAMTAFLASCSKAGDPTTAKETALDSVKAAFKGTWVFASVKVIQTSTNKYADVNDCDGTRVDSELSTTVFKSYQPMVNYAYSGTDANTVIVTSTCGTIQSSNPTPFTVSQNTDGTFSLIIENATAASSYEKWVIKKSSDVTGSTIKATRLNYQSIGFTEVFTFTKQ